MVLSAMQHSFLPQKSVQQLLKTFALMFAAIMAFLAPPVLSIAQDTNAQKLQSQSTQNISIERQQELTYMVQQDCGSCHGMTLKGGLGPSLLPERVSVLPKQYLINAVTHGRQGTPMPPWGPILKQNEIIWIVEQLQLGQLGQKKQP